MLIMKDKITFVVFTYNEADRIERVIRNFKNFGKILIADNNSTDATQEIARRHGCDIFLRREEYVFVENQKLVNQLYDVIDTEWIYWAFADEMLDEKTLMEIQSVVKGDQYDIITMDRKNYFYGNFCYDLYHARTYKVFKKYALDFTENEIHGMGRATVSPNKVYDLPDKFFIHHFISNTAESYLNVINRYTNSELASKYKVKTSLLYFILLCGRIILRDLFNSKAYKTGFSSVALTQLMIFYALVKNMKHYEAEHNLTTRKIEEKNNERRDKILNSTYH